MVDLDNLNHELEELVISHAYKCPSQHCDRYWNPHSKSLTIIHMNIRSINKNFDEFYVLLSSFSFVHDILVLSECWLMNTVHLPKLDGFISYSSKNARNQNEGVVIYVRNTLKHVILEPSFTDANCLICKVDDELAIIGLYRSPSYKNTDNFILSLNNALLNLSSFKHIVIIGDVNIDIKAHNKDPHSHEYLNTTASHGLLPGHLFPTRGDSCLDHVLIKSSLESTTLVTDSTITDHYSIIFNLNFQPMRRLVNKIGTKIDYPTLIAELKVYDFSEIYTSHDVNLATDLFLNKLISLLQTHTISFVIPCRLRTIKPWVTTGLVRCMRNRDNMHKSVKANPNNLILVQTYKRYRNFCNDLLKRLRREFERSEFNKVKNNPKKTWKVIKSITQTGKETIPPLELLNNFSDSQVSINSVNSYFSNIGKKLASKIIHASVTETTVPKLTYSQLNSMVLPGVSEQEVIDVIRGLRGDCASGWDGIPPKLFKLACPALAPVITYVCNLAIESGKFPNSLKKAIVHPIYKSGDRDSVNNYRPISVLPTLSKVLEKILNKALSGFLDSNKIISDYQFGFRKNISTEDAVSSLVKHTVAEIERKQKCLGIFLDLSKAFDTVCVPLLINKLEVLGVRGNVLSLFSDYLSNRTQCTKIGPHISKPEQIEYGVPQGSILGPTLFLLYVNDLCSQSYPYCRLFAYADDTALIVSGNTWVEAIENAEFAMKQTMTWLNRNLLTLNIDKTKFLTFASRKSVQPPRDSITLKAHVCNGRYSACNCSEIARTDNIRYLGVLVDSCFNWYDQLELVTTRIRSLIFIFKKLRGSADKQILFTVYTSLCESLITYCIPIWGCACKTKFINIERAQRAVLKVMLGKPFGYSTRQLYRDAGVLTVRQLFIHRSVLRQHSCLPSIPKETSLSTRRRKPAFDTIACRTEFARRQIYSSGSRIYNKVNISQQIDGLNRYDVKNNLKSWLLNLDYFETEQVVL